MNDQDPKADCPRARTMRYIKAHAASIAHDVEAAELSLRSGTVKTWEQIRKELKLQK
ncbi:MAG: hypothetical protein ACRDTX_30025 [Pseudonocardiaceae bacterium]